MGTMCALTSVLQITRLIPGQTEVGGVCVAVSKCLLPFPCRKYTHRLYTDSLVHDEQALKYLLSTIGEDNIVLGSDYPFPLGEHHPGKLVESVEDWDQERKVRVCHRPYSEQVQLLSVQLSLCRTRFLVAMPSSY